MAKRRHRTFEIFDFANEASEALASKSAREHTYSLDPDLWRFHRLDAAVRPSGVVHMRFKPVEKDSVATSNEFGKDLDDLADLLANGSRVLLDFEGVSEFDADAIAKLTEFHGKLQHRGSRVVLCNLEPEVLGPFFPHRNSGTTPST